MQTEIVPKATVPEGQRGRWKIERFTMTKAASEATRMHAMLGHPRNYCPAGRYTRLIRDNVLVASDSLSERREQEDAVMMAHGRVLINGLGLGVTVQACLLKPNVEHVAVVELDQDVIDLVAPHLLRGKLSRGRLDIICADALAFKPPRGVRYGMVWHDIWDTICEDNLPAMCKLHRKYGRRCDWQASWARRECERLRGGNYRPNRLLRFL